MKKLGLWMASVLLIAALLLGALAEAGSELAPEVVFETQEAASEAGEVVFETQEAVPEVGEVVSEALEGAVPEAEEFELSDLPDWEAGEPEELGELDLAAPEEAWDAPEAEYQVSAEEGPITLYYLNEKLFDRIPLPDGALTGYQIQAAEDAKFETKNMTGDSFYKATISVLDDGYVLPRLVQGGFGDDNLVSNEVVIVTEGGQTREIGFQVINYAQSYADQVLDRILATEITDGMTDLEKLAKVTEICARDFDYDGEVSGYVYMICFGGADCWGSTNFICEACKRLGIQAKGRDARSDPGAGNGHMNVLAEIDGKNYIADAGYSGSKPRYWYVQEEGGKTLFSKYSGGYGNAQGGSAEIASAEMEALRAVAGKQVGFAVSTGTGAKTLYLYDEAGNELASWSASSQSVLSGDQRLWRVKYAFAEAGSYNVSFRASDGEQLTGPVSLAVAVRGDENALVSAAFAVERVSAGANARIDVVTGKDVGYLFGYDESGEVKWIWYASSESVYQTEPNSIWSTSTGGSSCYVVNGQRRWTFWMKYDELGTHSLTLRPAATRESEQGEGKAIGIEVTRPFALSIELRETEIKAAYTIYPTVRTLSGIKKVEMLDADGAVLQEKESRYSSWEWDRVYGSVYKWTFNRKVDKPGDYTWYIRCMGEDGEYGEAVPFSFRVTTEEEDEPAPSPTVAPESGQAASLTLKKNTTKKLKAGDTLAVKVSGGKVKSWKSDSTAVATVSKQGLVTAKAAGTAKITATLTNKKKLVLTVKVSDVNAPKSVKITKGKSAKLKVGKKLQLKAEMNPSKANGTLSWSSSNTKVATVSKTGKVTAKKAGTAKITVSTQNGKKAVITIKVTKK